MSQTPFPQPLNDGFAPYKVMPVPETNGIGLAGFVVSIASLFLCGIPAIIGILFSLVGLFKRPRGFAIAGLIVGMVALLEMVGIGAAMFLTARVAKEAASEFSQFTTEAALTVQANRIADQWQTQGTLPTEAEGQQMLNGQTDLVGNPLIFETDGVTFSLRSAGRDQDLHTTDDVVVGPFASVDEVRNLKLRGIDFGEDFDLGDDFGKQLNREIRDALDDHQGEMKKAQSEMRKAQRELQQQLKQQFDGQFDKSDQ